LKRYLVGALLAILCVQTAEAGASKQSKAEKPTAKATTEDTSSKVPELKLGSVTQAKLPENLRAKRYFYSSFGTRDPFRSLVDGTFEAKLQDLVDMRTVTLVGVLSEDDEHIAMVQDSQGFGYNLRPGDRVRSGTVVSVGKDAMVARLNVFGQTTRVTLRLQREE
jgi:hypothetical protein